MPETPLQTDLSRARLKHLATWIRDDLDRDIAQNGPEHLHPDDVLTLHELFVALRFSPTITVLDLRATGIHRAVMEVSGIATRWPGRLADDCDKVVQAWTAKFGRLEELHPFMYGRGGRLEGIAGAGETSKAVSHFQSHLSERRLTQLYRPSSSVGKKCAQRRYRRTSLTATAI